MKYFLKSYKSMTSQGYRICMLVVVPLLFLVLLAAGKEQSELVQILGGQLLFLFLLTFDFFSDTMAFGGICHKEVRGIKLVQTSQSGMRVLRNAILLDCIRRAILLVGAGGLIAVCLNQRQYWVIGLAGYFIVTLALNASRYLCEAMLQFAFSGTMFALMAFIDFYIWYASEEWKNGMLILGTVFGIASVAATIGTICHMIYRIGGSRNV